MSTASALTIAGGSLEIGGLLTALANQLGISRHFFPERRGSIRRRAAALAARANARWLRLTDFLRRPHPVYPVHVRGAARAGSTAGGSLSIKYAIQPPVLLEDRVRWLQGRVASLQSRIDEQGQRADAETARVEKEMQAALAEIKSSLRTNHAVERALTARTLQRERIGFFLFLFGVGLSTWGGVLGNA